MAQGCGLPYQWRSADKGKYRLRPYYYGSSGSDRGESGLGLGLTDEQSVNGPRIVGQMSYVEILCRLGGSISFHCGCHFRIPIRTTHDTLGFILSEEDRTSLTAIEYWFRVLDLDDDGVLSLFELEQLWECQEQRLAKEGCTSFDFRDIICVALDLVKTQPSPNFYAPPSSIVNWTSIPPESDIHFACVPTSPLTIRLADLRKSPPLAARFYDYFINVTKFLERENTNGNRLIREIDEAQQMFLQQQQFLGLTGSTCIVSPDEIPTDNLTPFARWADAEYDHYIRMEEVDSQKELQQQSLLQHYAMDEYPVAISEDSAAAGIDGADVDAAGVRRAIATATKTWKRNRIRLRRTWVNRKKARSHSGEDDDEDEGNFEDIDGDYDSDEEEDDDDEEDDEGAYAELIAEPQFRDIVAVTLSETPDEESLDEEELVARMQLQRLVGKSDQTMPATAAADVSCADLTEELPQVAPVAAAPLSSSPNSAFIAPLGTLFNEHPGHVSRLQSSSPPRSPPCIGGRMAPGRGAGSPTKMNAPVFTAADDDDENDDGAASEDPHLQISETIADID